MRFGKTLRNSVYPPWTGKYIDYAKLKNLLREHDVGGDDSDNEGSPWTDRDEEAFVNELVNTQLEKVKSFQVETSVQLRERTSHCETKLRQLVAGQDEQEPPVTDEQERRTIASEVLEELDSITKEVSELQKYSRINFTGFLKAAKKHDRIRGAKYKVKTILQVRLSQLPLNSEDYSPLVNRLTVMYSFAREVLSQDEVEPREPADGFPDRNTYYSYKFWVHEDNLLEVKAFILRRLPVLIYRSKASTDLTGAEDPTITSLYFDNPQFDLYNQKVAKAPEAGSLRLRWTGKLKDKPAIFLEKKVITDEDSSRDVRLQMKEKHIQEFLQGEYRFDKKIHRMLDSGGGESAEAESLKGDVEEIQSFIRENNLQPMLRANYTRTAFQVPGDDRIRISLDTNLALIREDSLDADRPCREPSQWHRTDIDDVAMEYPFDAIRTGEIVRFPHALLEIKLRGNARNAEWVKDLMVSHLVKEAPRFSKFVHGVAQLFDDYVNNFPFWLGELDSDIRRDPETAFQEEQERKAKRAEDEMAVGSFKGGGRTPTDRFASISSPSQKGKAPQVPRPTPKPSAAPSHDGPDREQPPEEQRKPTKPHKRREESQQQQQQLGSVPSRLASLFPSLPTKTHQTRTYHKSKPLDLPPGVRDPGKWIKDSGPVRVESKVWLANQRTFIKWLHISILLSSLSLGLYNAAGRENDIARALGVAYTFFAIFAAGWGWYMYEVRSRLIRQRSGKDLDNVLGPVVVCIGLAAALVMNFGFKVCLCLSFHPSIHPLYRTLGLRIFLFFSFC